MVTNRRNTTPKSGILFDEPKWRRQGSGLLFSLVNNACEWLTCLMAFHPRGRSFFFDHVHWESRSITFFTTHLGEKNVRYATQTSFDSYSTGPTSGGTPLFVNSRRDECKVNMNDDDGWVGGREWHKWGTTFARFQPILLLILFFKPAATTI